ncbi:MAG: rod shape-determining protein MreC [Alphaproteobacteria bacterium]|nr:rod shape-determining protein MreC [Alphaproteobacteria bacterium]
MARRSRHGLAARINPQHTLLIVLTVIAILLLISGQVYKNLYDGMRSNVMSITSPLINIATAPFRMVGNISNNIGDYQTLQQQYQDLKIEMRQASYWEFYARQLLAENQLLRQRWNLPDDFPTLPGNFVVARVIADLSGTFINSFLINAGKNQNIAINDIAMDNGALVGRIIDVKNKYSRVLLITDINSRVPIVVGDERLRAIMGGNNSDQTDLLFAAIDSVITPGMKILTSGHGGVFPAGIPIGQVISNDGDNIKIAPLAVPHQIEYVDILSFAAKIIPNDKSKDISQDYQERQN